MSRTAAAVEAVDEQAATVRVFESAASPADPVAMRALRTAAAEVDLAAPAIVLPDFHFKRDKEMPSSIAVATRETINPTFTCCSLNCGMALVAFRVERPERDAVEDFYRRVRERLPSPPTYRRDLSAAEVVRAATEGAFFAVDKFGVDPAATERMEHGGRIDADPYGGAERIRRELPWTVTQLSRIRFATIGRSNHFIELQEVEEVFDEERAALLGIERGQVTMQYHGGGGALPGELGVLFGRRKRFPRALRIQMAVQKPLYHLASARSVAEFNLRRALYFSGGFPPVERQGVEGERLMLSNLMAMNYGFAFRLSAYAILTQLAEASFGTVAPRLVVDSPHNSIYEERGSRCDRDRASAQRGAGVPGLANGRASGLRQDGPAAAPPRDEPNVVVPVRRERGRTSQPLLGLARLGLEHRELHRARPFRA